MPEYTVKVGDAEYDVTAPDENTAWQWANMHHSQAARPAEAAKEYAGFTGSFRNQLKTLLAAPEAAAFAADQTPETREALIKARDSGYKSADFGLSPTEDLSTFGRNVEAAKEMVGGTLGSLVAPLAAAAVGSPTVVGAPVAGFSTAAAQYEIENIAAAAREQQAAIDAGRTPEEFSLLKSTVAAAGQTGLDIVGGKVFAPLLRRFPLFKNLAVGGKPAEEALDVMADAAKNGKWDLSGPVARGVGKGIAFEAPQEMAQQALELWQAGVPTDQWRDQLIQAGVGGALLGGPIGGAQAALGSRAGTKEKTGEGFGEGETPPPPPPGGPLDTQGTAEEVKIRVNNQTDEENIAELGRVSPDVAAAYTRYRSMGQSKASAFDTSVRDAIKAETPSGLKQTNLGETGGTGTGGRESGVPPTGRENVAKGVAPAATELGREGLGVSGGVTQQPRGAEAGKPGALDQIIAEQPSAAGEALTREFPKVPPAAQTEATSELPLIQYSEQANAENAKLDNDVAFWEGRDKDNQPAAEQAAPTAPAATALTLDPVTPRKERTAQAVAAVKSVADTHEDFADITPNKSTINQAAQSLVLTNGGDPYMALMRVLEGEPAPKKAKAEAKVAEEVPFEGAPVAKAAPEVVAPAAPKAAPEVVAPAAPKTAPEAVAPAAPKAEPVAQPKLDAKAEAKAQADAERAISGYAYAQNKPAIDEEWAAELERVGAPIEEASQVANQLNLPTTPLNEIKARLQGRQKVAPAPKAQVAPEGEAQVAEPLFPEGLPEQRKPSLQRAEGKTEAAEGMFSPLERLIRVALDSKGRLETLHHEAIHAMRSMGLFKDSEWAVLSKRAKDEWIAKYEIKTKYKGDNLTEEQEIEEAVAEAYADYVANKNQGGKTKTLFDRMRNFLKAVVDAVAGRPEAVFRRIEKGEVGRRDRKTAKGEAAQGPTYKGSSTYTTGRNAERAQVENALRKRLDELGLYDVDLKVPDSMTVERGEKGVSLQRKAEEKLSKAQAKFAASNTASRRGSKGVISGLVDGILGRDPKAWNDNFERISHNSGIGTAETLGNVLPTSSILRLISSMNKQAGEAAKRIVAAADVFADTKANLNDALATFIMPVVKFVNKHGYGELAALQSAARLNKVNALAHPDVQTAIKEDQLIKGYDELIANAKTPSEKADYQAGRASREAAITETYALRDALAELPGGLEAYKLLRQFYIDANTMLRASRDRMFDTLTVGDAGARARLQQSRKDYFEKIKTAPDSNYHGLERTLIPEEYSPFMRFGDYWLRVEKGVAGEPEYYHFEDPGMRNQFIKERAQELGITSPEEMAQTFKTGVLSTNEGRASFLSSDAALAEMFNLIDSNNRLSPEQKESFKDQAYQARLEALPESDLRKHFKHAKERTGYSTDPLRVFQAYSTKFVNALANAEHRNDFNMRIQEAREVLDGQPPGSEKDKLQAYIEAVVEQAKSGVNPPDTNALVTAMNRIGFLYFLSGGATAMAQFTSVPMRVVPSVGSRYGYGTATRLLGKWSKAAYRGKAIREKLPDGTSQWVFPSVGKSPEVKNVPHMREAFEWAEEHRVFSLGPTAAILDTGATPESALGVMDNKVKTAVLQVGSAAFRATENLSREMGFMMHYEAAYNALVAKGVDPKVAKIKAREEAAELTEKTLLNYRETERPQIMKGPVGRMVFMFKSFVIGTTKAFLELSYDMLKNQDPQVRRQAFKELAGILGIGAVFFHGIGGLPGASLVMSAIELIRNALEDDEDKRRRQEEDPVFADNFEGYFRYKWLPEHFGALPARVMDVGLLSSLTPLDLASRTSYNNMWLREGLPGKNWVEDAKNLMLANIGPAVSMGGSLDLAAKDFNDGEVMRGVERLMPAIARGPLMARRLATEGLETRRGDEVVGAEEISNGAILAATLNISPRIVTEAQGKKFAALKFQNKVESAKAAALRAMNKATKSQNDAELERATKLVADYNAKYPSQKAITSETIQKSYDAFVKLSDKMMSGVPVEDDEVDWYQFLISTGGE